MNSVQGRRRAAMHFLPLFNEYCVKDTLIKSTKRRGCEGCAGKE